MADSNSKNSTTKILQLMGKINEDSSPIPDEFILPTNHKEESLTSTPASKDLDMANILSLCVSPSKKKDPFPSK